MSERMWDRVWLQRNFPTQFCVLPFVEENSSVYCVCIFYCRSCDGRDGVNFMAILMHAGRHIFWHIRRRPLKRYKRHEHHRKAQPIWYANIIYLYIFYRNSYIYVYIYNILHMYKIPETNLLRRRMFRLLAKDKCPSTKAYTICK